MWVSIGIVLVGIAVALLEVQPLLKKGLMKELWVFSILLLLGTGLGIAETWGKELPNPLDWMIVIYKPLTDTILGLF